MAEGSKSLAGVEIITDECDGVSHFDVRRNGITVTDVLQSS